MSLKTCVGRCRTGSRIRDLMVVGGLRSDMLCLRGVAMVPMLVLALLAVLMSCGAVAAPSEDIPDAMDITGLRFTSQNNAPDVTLPKLGTLSGSTTTSSKKQRTIYQYLGVPFAKAPVDELRFKEPVPVDPWSSKFDASKPGKACVQMTGGPSIHALRATRTLRAISAEDQSEDCLLLNVFSPQVNSSAKLPVLVFVHGGSFTSGSARDLPPNNLLDYDIILVTPQYRLGPLGFMNLQEDEVPGNAGLLDVLAALQWVQDNIQSFGGDPQQVTLGGHSSGGALVSLAYLSPLSTGLFRSVLPMSGSSLAFWSWDQRPEESAKAIAALLKCDSSDSAARVSCLRSATPDAIKMAFIQYSATTMYQGVGIGVSGGGPSLQRAGKIVLPDLPENILRNKAFSAKPLLTGITKHEGTFAMAILENGYIKPHKLDQDGTFYEYDLIHVALGLLNVDDPAGFVADSALGYFFDPSTLGNPSAMRNGLIDLYGAYSFKCPCHAHALHNSQAGQPTYLYSFNHYGSGTNTNFGITHGSDQIYLFPLFPSLFPLPTNTNDVAMGNELLEFVTNFVIHQNPTPPSAAEQGGLPHWEPFLEGNEHYMELTVPSALQQNFSKELTAARTEHFRDPSKTSPSTPVVTQRPAVATTQQPASATTSPPPSGAQSVAASTITTALLALLVVLTSIRR